MTRYRFELKGGPLAGREARISDTGVRITVVREGCALHLHGSDELPYPSTPRPIGHYGFSVREESLVWFPSVE